MNSATRQQATPPTSPNAAVPTPAAAPPRPHKVNLADVLFGSKHSGSTSPVFHKKDTTFPPWIHDIGAMKTSVDLPIKKTKKQKQKSPDPSTPSTPMPAKQKSIAWILFWGIMFLGALYAASPAAVARMKNYHEAAINALTDVFGHRDDVLFTTTATVQITTIDTVIADATTFTSVTPTPDVTDSDL